MVEEKKPPTKKQKVSEDEEVKIWESVDKFVDKITNNIEDFAVPKETKLYPEIANITKVLFDLGKDRQPEEQQFGVLPSLLVEGFDTEQIWEEIQTFNKPLLTYAQKTITQLEEEETYDDDDDIESDENDEGEEIEDDEDIEGEDEENEDADSSYFDNDEDEDDDSAVDIDDIKDEDDDENEDDAEFFDKDEMEEFIKDAERREAAGSDYESEEDEDDEVADIFANYDDDSEATNLRFSDFFDKPKSKHESENQKMAEKIEKLEEELISEKPWQMKGEVKSKDRPKASLLEENLAFEHATKTAPIITIESTNELEKIIKKRILEGSWDDVIRRKDTTSDDFKPKKTVELDHQKSKEGLAEIYEKEYLKQAGTIKEKDEDEELKQNLRRLFTRINYSLDALSNFHYTPKPVSKKDEETAKNVPAIQMEEVIPTNVSDANLLAPEEIYDKKKGPIKGDSELTTDEKTAKRRSMKAKKKKEKKQKERDMKAVEKLAPGLGNKYAKEKVQKELDDLHKAKNVTFIKGKDTTNYTSSNVFFNKLQENVKKSIEMKRMENVDPKDDKKKKKTNSSSSVKL